MTREQIGPVWVTKYALTKGIQRYAKAELTRDSTMVCAAPGDWWASYYCEKDWHRSEAEAIARAEQMRLARIKSLEAQLVKLRKVAIKIVDVDK